jgi:hypothetical protein
MIVLCANQKRDGGLVEAAPLPVPLLDRIERTLSRQIEHEKYRNSIVANQWQHVDEFTLTTQIPDGECNLGVSDRDGLLHKVDTCACQKVQAAEKAQCNVPNVWI